MEYNVKSNNEVFMRRVSGANYLVTAEIRDFQMIVVDISDQKNMKIYPEETEKAKEIIQQLQDEYGAVYFPNMSIIALHLKDINRFSIELITDYQKLRQTIQIDKEVSYFEHTCNVCHKLIQFDKVCHKECEPELWKKHYGDKESFELTAEEKLLIQKLRNSEDYQLIKEENGDIIVYDKSKVMNPILILEG